jgi:hypothetical protein
MLIKDRQIDEEILIDVDVIQLEMTTLPQTRGMETIQRVERPSKTLFSLILPPL